MTRRFAVFVIICLAACTAIETPAPTQPAETPAGRLPLTVVPLSYSLDLTIVPERSSFSGYVTIELDFKETVDRFFMHAKDIAVTEVLLRLADGATVAATYRETDVAGVAQILLARAILPQTAKLEMAYQARFGKKLKGLYRVIDGGTAYAFTQFEPVSARETFPCFDEPAFKTPFDISLTVARGHVAVSATPVIESIPLENGLMRHRFERTPPLPTYLIAFAVGPFDVVNAPAIPKTPQREVPLPLRGIATAGKGVHLQHALGTTPELLTLLEAYFDMAHPYPKLDIIAVPDFAAGAMENVGAITYRESLLLLADDAPVQQRRRHALVHAHEIAHQWFGNLVTMPWWDDIWLNEAFASWMAFRTVAEWDPAHRAGLSRLKRLKNAMDEDALGSARQIRQPVLNEDDIENAFDGITYSKGGAVLGMFERYLGDEPFRAAIRYHIARFAHGNADVTDFIESLAHIGGERVGEAFRSFLFQPGIPLLDVHLDCDTEASVTIRQSRFRPIGSEAGAAAGWTVPICMRYGDAETQREKCALVGPAEKTLSLDMNSCPTWLLPNAGFAGYFHWLVPASDYPGLIAAEKHLTAAEQLSIGDSIDAAFAAGRLSVGETADLLAALAHSERPQVALAPKAFIEYTRDNLVTNASTLHGLTGYVDKLYSELPAQEAFSAAYMAELPNDSRRLFLIDVAEIVAGTGNALVRDTARRHADDWIAGRRDRLAPAAVELALRVAVEDDAVRFVPPLRSLLADSRDGQQRRTILRALARTSDPALAEKVRDIVFSKDIRINEIRNFIREHVKQSANRSASWAWLQQNFDRLVQRLPPRDAGRLPAEIGAVLCDEAAAVEVESFLAPRIGQLVGGPRNLAKAVEQIQLCARRAAVQRPQADAYFQNSRIAARMPLPRP